MAKLKMLMKILLGDLLRLLFLPFCIFPIRKNRVAFASLTGGDAVEYTCNPRYVYESLREIDSASHEYVWIMAKPEEYPFLEEEGARLVRHFSLRAFYYLLTSRVVVTSGSYAPWVPFRRGQDVVQTWHGGGAYKKNNGEGGDDALCRRLNARAGRNVTAFVTSSDAFTRYVVWETFDFHGELLEVGMPRNDRLVRGEVREDADRVREWFRLPRGCKILLYAPTYRDGDSYEPPDISKVLDAIGGEGEEWHCLARAHRYGGAREARGADPRIHRAERYPEMQELLAAADMLLTDYSSCIWDYCFRDAPCYLYVPDLKEYRKKRGFYVDIEKWHIPYAESFGELLGMVSNWRMEDWSGRMEAHRRILGSVETGEAAPRVAAYIARRLGSVIAHSRDDTQDPRDAARNPRDAAKYMEAK